jgi:hypothetical protein
MLKAFPIKSWTKEGCSLLSLLINIVLEVLNRAIRKGREKERKDIKIGKVVILSIRTNKFSEVLGYKTKIQKSVEFLYIKEKLSKKVTNMTTQSQ